ncbi:MAG TPA: ABC transporter permease [Thermomicrobiaceae bacterium]|nr:ABC transporter permease [Thermomicrobiaceae bacterium]
MNQIVARLAQAVLTVFGALTIVFFILHLTPGDPVQIMLGDYATPELISALRQHYGLDRPLPVQYVTFLKNTVTGNFGMSLSQKSDVTVVIRSAMSYTVELAIAAMIVTCVIGIPLGMIAALKRNTAADFAAMVIALLGVATPGFLLALLMIYLLSYRLGWFPVQGAGSGGLGSNLHHLILPAVALGFESSALVARTTRSALLAVLGEDYIRTARAKGLSSRAVVQTHALRPALVPILAVLGLYFGQLLGGAGIAEIVFGRPGLGKLLIDAILVRDYPLSQALIFVFLVAVIGVNFVTDTLYGFADPRLRWS